MKFKNMYERFLLSERINRIINELSVSVFTHERFYSMTKSSQFSKTLSIHESRDYLKKNIVDENNFCQRRPNRLRNNI